MAFHLFCRIKVGGRIHFRSIDGNSRFISGKWLFGLGGSTGVMMIKRKLGVAAIPEPDVTSGMLPGGKRYPPGW